MTEVRCGKCSKKLAEGNFQSLSIKCPRCGTLNFLSATGAKSERHGTPSRSHHASDQRKPATGQY